MNSNIYQIEQRYLEIINALEESEGELTPEMEAALSINEEERDKKIGAYISVIKQKKADVVIAKDEAKRYTAMAKRAEQDIERLSNTILAALEVFGLYGKSGNLSHKVDGHTLYSKDTQSVVPTNEGLGFDGEVLYAEFLDFKIKNKLSNSQVEIISKALSEEKDNYAIIETEYSVKKEDFKTAYNNALLIADEDERSEALEHLKGLAILEDKRTLVIR